MEANTPSSYMLGAKIVFPKNKEHYSRRMLI